MSAPDAAWWERARAARDRLVAQLIDHPNVRMIDIGLDPERTSSTPVLRVHIRQRSRGSASIPNEVDGIPVRTILGDYEIQEGQL